MPAHNSSSRDGYKVSALFYFYVYDLISLLSRCVDIKRAVSLLLVSNLSQTDSISAKLPRCEKWLREGCYDRRDLINCDAAVKFCEQLVMDPFRYNGNYLLRSD
jgi:hypothetical protein